MPDGVRGHTVPYAACEGCACLQSRSTPDLSLRHHCHARHTREQRPISFGYLLTKDRMIICDDAGVAHRMFQRIREENPQLTPNIGGLLYGFLELLIAKDMHHLQELEEMLSQLEEQVLEGGLDNLNHQMTVLRKELTNWGRYYTQLEDMVCEFEENENKFFTDIETRQFHMVEKRIARLKTRRRFSGSMGCRFESYFRRRSIYGRTGS